MICKVVEVIFRVQWGQETCLGVPGGQGDGGSQGGQGGQLGDPMGPSGWFDESPDDSWTINACMYIGVQIFIAYRQVHQS